MPETQRDRTLDDRAVRPGSPALNAAVRRHLGVTLRSFYAPALSEPFGDRIEDLLTRLRKSRR